jgi:hypothetical protein
MQHTIFDPMPNAIKHIVRSVAALLVIAAIALLSMNQIWFKHSHIDKHGHAYNHSHPYDKSHDDAPFKQHNHPLEGYCVFDASHFYDGEEKISVPHASITNIHRHWGDIPGITTSCHIFLGAGRAPPPAIVASCI